MPDVLPVQSVPPPGTVDVNTEVPAAPTADPTNKSPAASWVKHNAIFSAVNGTVFVSALAAWTALGSSGGAAVLGALALCVAVPVLGWFIGIPVVLGTAMAGAAIWVAGFFAILMAWFITTVAVALFTYCYQQLKSRS